MSQVNSRWAAIAAAAAAVWLYAPTGQKLVYDWLHDDNYSHGILIVPLALYFSWERRGALLALRPEPSITGLLVVLGSLGLLVAGTLGAELFLTRVSIVGALVGSIVFLAGWAYLRVLAFPVALLLLMIPIPAIIFNQIAFPLQIFASRFGTAVMQTFGVPVLREGNVLVLADTTLEVAEACSGIRSLISLLTLGIVYGYFADRRMWVRFLISASTVPIAIVANGARVAGTGILAHYYGPQAAEGFFHTFSGWLVFLVAFGMLFVIARAIVRLVPASSAPSATGAAA